MALGTPLPRSRRSASGRSTLRLPGSWPEATRALLGVLVQGLFAGGDGILRQAPQRLERFVWTESVRMERASSTSRLAIGERRNDGHEKGSACGDLDGEAGDGFVQIRVVVQAACLRRSRARS